MIVGSTEIQRAIFRRRKIVMRRFLRRLRAQSKGIRLHGAELKRSYKVYGTSYGGWPALDQSLSADSIVYSFGLGEDISFDTEIIRNFGCSVWGFDPTPKSVEWMARQRLPPQFNFKSVGLAAKEGEIEFFPPADSKHVSYSVAPGKEQRQPSVRAPVQPLAAIMRDLGHNAVDLLKMDIEGFEYEVIPDLIRGQIRPKQLLVEFHHQMYNICNEQTCEAVDKLKGYGYGLFYVSDGGREYGFVEI